MVTEMPNVPNDMNPLGTFCILGKRFDRHFAAQNGAFNAALQAHVLVERRPPVGVVNVEERLRRCRGDLEVHQPEHLVRDPLADARQGVVLRQQRHPLAAQEPCGPPRLAAEPRQVEHPHAGCDHRA
eukprot:gene2487-biopygen6536